MYLLSLILLLVSQPSEPPATYFSRTGHVFVQSSNDIMDIKAHNYQLNSSLDPQSGETTFTGLIKSFEFELGLADRLFSGKRVNVQQHPKMTFSGKVVNYQDIDFTIPGTYTARIQGTLEIWGYERNTETEGEIRVMPDGTLEARSEFLMRIEQESMDKINELMRRHLPAVVSVNTDQLGVSQDIMVEVDLTYRKR